MNFIGTTKYNAAQDGPEKYGSPDGEERVRDFLARHGGASNHPSRAGIIDPDIRGWSEIYAADGYTLRCDWSRAGSRGEWKFAELPPKR